jgi:DNA-directed RNA polymerase specialized sigma24 family protein
MDRNEPNVAEAVDAGRLFAVHRLALLRLAVLLVGDRATAEDVVQDAFAGLHARWSELRDSASALA